MEQKGSPPARNTHQYGGGGVPARFLIVGTFVLASLVSLVMMGYGGARFVQLLEERERVVADSLVERLARDTQGAIEAARWEARLLGGVATSSPLFSSQALVASLRQAKEAGLPAVYVRLSSPQGAIVREEFLQDGAAPFPPARWFALDEGHIGISTDESLLWVRAQTVGGGQVEAAFDMRALLDAWQALVRDGVVDAVRLEDEDGKVLLAVGEGSNRMFGRAVALALSPSLPFSVRVWLPASVTAQVAETARFAVAAAIVTVALLLVAGVLMLERLLFQPLAAFAAVAEEVGRGNFSVRLPACRARELCPLRQAFHHMLEYIRTYNAQLVARLRRTIEEQERAAKLLLRRDLELREANERLRELDRQKSEFVSVAAHQLRTPLSAIRWALSLVLGGEYGPLTPAQRSVLERAQASNLQMIALVNDLLDVDRIESGRTVFRWEEVDVCEAVDEELRNHFAAAQAAGIALSLSVTVHPCPRVRIDKKLFQQALQNLVENAIKYTPKGGRVDVRLYRKEGEPAVILEVADTGIGIPKEAQKQLFTRFYRAPNAQLRQTEGSGLGLYLVKQILERMRCTIFITSEEGKGTTVRVVIPTLPPQQEKET